MRSTMSVPSGAVWSKKPFATMLSLCPLAALRSFAFSFSGASPRALRSLLCRHSTAARITGRFPAAGIRSVFVQTPCALRLA
jgi:hypothetical protein